MKFQGEREERQKMHDLRRSQASGGGQGSSTFLAIGDVLESNRFPARREVGQCAIGPRGTHREICRFFDGWPGERVKNAWRSLRTLNPGSEQVAVSRDQNSPTRRAGFGMAGSPSCAASSTKDKRRAKWIEIGAISSLMPMQHLFGHIRRGALASRSRVRLAMKCQLESTT